MRLKLIATFFFLGSYLSAQQTVTTSGGEIKSNQVSLSYTIGQLKVNTIEKVDSSILELDFIQVFNMLLMYLIAGILII